MIARLALLCLCVTAFLGSGCCVREVGSETVSPDGQVAAADVLVNCHATTPFVTEVVLRPAHSWLPVRQVVLRYHGADTPRMQWLSAQELLIEADLSAGATKQLDVWGNINIRYSQRKRTAE
jgi:hypothetical protein